MGMMSPSVQELSYSPRQRARVHRIQTSPGGANPTADNGLENAQDVVTQGRTTTGTSKGYKVVKASLSTSNGQTFAEVGPVTVGVTGMGTAPVSAGWGYNAQIITPKMFRGTTGEITQPSTPGHSVMVGEQNTVSVGLGVSAVGNEPLPITYQWSQPGDAIKSYIETSTPGGLPGTSSKVNLTSADLNSFQLQFYWYKGGDLFGQNKGLSVVVNIAGTPITVSGQCKLYRPQMISFVGTYKAPPTGMQTVRLDAGEIGVRSGIETNASVGAPNIPSAAGSIYIIQVSHNNSSKVKGEFNGTPYYYGATYFGQDGKTAVDSIGNDPVYGSENPATSTHRTISPGGTVSTYQIDFPGYEIQPSNTGFDFSQYYTSYLMYQPSSANSIRTVLGKVSWGWSAKGTRAITNGVPGPWTLTNVSPQYTTSVNISPGNVEATEHPIWEKTLEGVQLEPIGPWS
jgi:hypothetical protein